jgi:hypothetical protein
VDEVPDGEGQTIRGPTRACNEASNSHFKPSSAPRPASISGERGPGAFRRLIRPFPRLVAAFEVSLDCPPGRVDSWLALDSSYRKIGDFWLPESNESETKVRVFGTAVLSIEYRDYQITQAGNATVAYSHEKPLSAQ